MDPIIEFFLDILLKIKSQSQDCLSTEQMNPGKSTITLIVKDMEDFRTKLQGETIGF